MTAITSDSIEAHSTASARRPPVVWLAAVIFGLTLFGVADMLAPMWRSGGVDFRGVRSRLVWEDGRKVLLIEGEIANPRRASVSVAPIRLSVRNRQGFDLYSWTIAAPKAYLSGGDRAPFFARLPTPPEEGVETVVRLEQPVEAAPPASSRSAAAPRARRLDSAAPLSAARPAVLSAALSDDIPNLRKMP